MAFSAVRDMIADRHGRLWSGSWGQGISRYDGYNCRQFRYDSQDTMSLSSSRVNQLMEDSGGDIWAATLYGLNRLDPRTEKFSRYRLPSERAYTTAVFQLSDHTMLVGETRGMWSLDTDTRRFERFVPTHGGDPDKEPLVGQFMRTTDGQVWGASSRSLLKIDPHGRTYQHIAVQCPGSKDSLGCTVILQDREGRFWVGTSRGLLRFFPENQRFEWSGLPDTLSRFVADDILEDADGSLWLGGSRGLLHWVPGQSAAEHYYSVSQQYGIMPAQVNALCRDRFGNVWVGTNGIRKTKTGPSNFRFFQIAVGVDLPANRLYWCMEDERGGMFYKSGREAFYAPQLGQAAQRANLPKGKDMSNFKQAISNSADGRLWSAWLGGGLGVWQPETRTFAEFLPDTAFGHRRIEGHCHDRAEPDWLWLGFRDGIWRLDKKTGERRFFKPEKLPPHGLVSGELCDDGHGGLWFDVGGGQGLGFFDKTTARFHILRHNSARPDQSIVNDEVFDISAARDGSVWVACISGTSHIVPVGRGNALPDDTQAAFRFQNFTPRNSLPATDYIISIEADVAGEVWLRSNESALRFQPETNSFQEFDIARSISGARPIVRKAMTATRSGMLFFVSREGVAVCDPTRLVFDTVPPAVMLTDIFVNNNRRNDIVAEFAHFLALQYTENAIAFEFAGVHTTAPTLNRYAYWLVGYDTAWVDCSSDLRRAAYTNLPAGSYVFKVKAANPDGVWSEPLEFSFFIAPPFWASNWFRFLVLLVLAAVIYGVLYTRLQQRKLAQEKELAEQNARYKSQFLANMSHEIRTPMNAILGLSRLLDELPLEAKQREYLGAIRHSSEDLLRIVNDILDYSKIESGRFSFQVKRFDLDTVLRHLDSTFNFRAKDKGIDFQVIKSSSIPTALEGDPVRLMQILSNLVGNAIKFTDRGSVEVRVSSEFEVSQTPTEMPNPVEPQPSNAPTSNFKLLFSVRDTGVGIPPEKLEQVFESFSQVSEDDATAKGGTGLGLSIARQLVEQQGGQIQLSSHLGEGTEVTFSLPFGIPQAAEISAADHPSTAKTRLRGLRILLVEDTYFNQLLAVELLKSKIEGAEVDLAENGQVALEKVAAQPYDLVLMDVKMPIMDGLEATRRIRQHPDEQVRRLPIVGLTANAVKEELEKCQAAGMDRWVTKPIQTEELMEAIEGMMNDAQ